MRGRGAPEWLRARRRLGGAAGLEEVVTLAPVALHRRRDGFRGMIAPAPRSVGERSAPPCPDRPNGNCGPAGIVAETVNDILAIFRGPGGFEVGHANAPMSFPADGIDRSWAKSLEAWWHWSVTRAMDGDRMRTLAGMLRVMETQRPLVRVGGAEDGGYLIPDDLEGVEACFSPGVGGSSDFERAMLDRGIPSFLIDASVEKPKGLPKGISFEKLFLGAATRGNTVSLPDWVARHAPGSGDLVLQMDIEGAEYDVLATSPRDVLRRFRVLLVEFHRTHRALVPSGHRRLMGALESLVADFVPVHLHMNNARPFVRCGAYDMPRAFEMTFLRRDRAGRMRPSRAVPHPLDTPNVPGHPDLPPPGWMTGSGA